MHVCCTRFRVLCFSVVARSGDSDRRLLTGHPFLGEPSCFYWLCDDICIPAALCPDSDRTFRICEKAVGSRADLPAVRDSSLWPDGAAAAWGGAEQYGRNRARLGKPSLKRLVPRVLRLLYRILSHHCTAAEKLGLQNGVDRCAKSGPPAFGFPVGLYCAWHGHRNGSAPAWGSQAEPCANFLSAARSGGEPLRQALRLYAARCGEC